MKAVILQAPDTPPAHLDVPEPSPGAGEVLVRVVSSSLNPFDGIIAAGYMRGMLEHVYPITMGRDVAGVVERVGPGVGGIVVGDEVLGFVSGPVIQRGTWAERVVLPEAALTRKPAGLRWAEAGVLPLAVATAAASVDAVALRPADVVLIVGASGGVGSFAVQLARARGARVIATARADDAERVRAMGAERTYDRTTGDVADQVRKDFPDGVDAVIDLASRGEAFDRIAALVRKDGRIATPLLVADVEKLAAEHGVVATNVYAQNDPSVIRRHAELAAKGSLVVTIGATYGLAEIDRAFATLQAGARGKIAIRVAEGAAP